MPPPTSAVKRIRFRSEMTSSSNATNIFSDTRRSSSRGKEPDPKMKPRTSIYDPRTQNIIGIKEQLRVAAVSLQTDSSRGSLDIDYLAKFIHKWRGKSNSHEIALNYNSNPQEVTDELSALETLVTNKNTKSRITRIIKHFKVKSDQVSWSQEQSELNNLK
ncbi:hypothetical protein QAD02_012981 [Eretmocerus hayati]|uniref:Uncharacterized protein n=1 Tax=Eretmocerus hayati TaxID=131215 RepID=A0ACC2P3S7_9HYME|nr:hypothetical protein QAD02_012981 [Eretmocerus hayati]